MRVLRHSRDSVGDFQRRVLLHIPIGLLIGIPLLGKPLEKLFTKYEENEDAHTQDEAWKDYFGAIVGVVITELICIALLVYVVNEVLALLS